MCDHPKYCFKNVESDSEKAEFCFQCGKSSGRGYSKGALVSCAISEVDLFENWAKFKIPKEVMGKGFHAGAVLIDFSGVQE